MSGRKSNGKASNGDGDIWILLATVARQKAVTGMIVVVKRAPMVLVFVG